MLEPYGVITGVMPIKEGWRYLQPMPDGSFQRIPFSGCAGTDENLVEMVKTFRANAGIDMEDVAYDVADFIRSVSRINDRRPGKPTKRPRTENDGQPGFRPYIERIRDWLLGIGPKRPRLLIEDEADERAKVCMKCPQNVTWKVKCLPCNDKVVSRSQNVRQRPAYKFDEQLGACRLHEFHNPAAVFIDRDFLPSLNEQAPQECWMRTEPHEQPDKLILRRVTQAEGTESPDFIFWCPACECGHGIWTTRANLSGAVWKFNGNEQAPTFTPSLLITNEWDDCSAVPEEGWGEWVPHPTLEGTRSREPKPEFQSLVVHHKEVCHLNVTNGILTYHPDCTHEYKGQHVPMQPF